MPPRTGVARKQHPYRVLAWMLYAKHPWLIRTFDHRGSVVVWGRIGEMSRKLQVPTDRLRGYLTYLQSRGYLSKLELKRGEFFAWVTPVEEWTKGENQDAT